MKTICRISLAIGVIFGLYVLFISGLTLRKTSNRPYTSYKLTEKEREEIKLLAETAESETDLVKLCNKMACRKLSFHKHNDLMNGKANCIGYAQYSAAILNYGFKCKGLSLSARPVVGQVYLYGINLHPITMAILPDDAKSFFKNHDFVEITSPEGNSCFIDTSLQDITGKSFM